MVLADDHAVVRAGLRLLLATDPALQVVGEAGDLDGTLAQLQRLYPAVLVLDLSLGGEFVLPAVPRLLAASPATRILVLTMHRDPAHAAAALRLGAHGYVLKDTADDELTRAIAAVARGQTYLDPTIGAAAVLLGRRPDDLTDRQRTLLLLVAAGLTNGEAAARMQVSLRTVEAVRAQLRQRLGLATRAELVRYARDHLHPA